MNGGRSVHYATTPPVFENFFSKRRKTMATVIDVQERIDSTKNKDGYQAAFNKLAQLHKDKETLELRGIYLIPH